MDEREQLAAEYALGSLEPEERGAVGRRAVSDPVLKGLIDDWETRLAPLAGMGAPADPPTDAFEVISRRLATTARAPAGTRTVRASRGGWQEVAPGLRMKLLLRDVEGGRQTMLLTIEPDTVYEGHHHEGVEEMFILSGDLTFGDFELGPGDHHSAAAGGDHPAAVSRTGCTALVMTTI